MLVGSAVLITSRSPASDKRFSIALKGSLTTGSQLFPNPNSSDVFQRAQFFSLKDIWGYGIEARYRFPETDLAIGLSADYLRIVESSSVRRSGFQIPVDDGYRVIPVELTGYFLIPLSGEVVGNLVVELGALSLPRRYRAGLAFQSLPAEGLERIREYLDELKGVDVTA